MIPQILAFLDVETTGTSPHHDRIIDIGIVRVENGAITHTLNSLVDPQEHIPPEITRITGLTSQILETAPTFRNLKDRIDELLEDSVIVAHNSLFDTAFLKSEYERIGEKFHNSHLCTVKLSRYMFPRYQHHNLDSIVERFGLTCEPRHRAYPDARVLWDFFQILLNSKEKTKLENAIKLQLKRPSLPKGISDKIVSNLPTSPGVYIFYGDKGSTLYVGKSINIISRVMSHFHESQNVTKEFYIAEQTKHIEFIETEGELSALLQEKKLISELKPLYNRRLREVQSTPVAIQSLTDGGYFTVKIINSTLLTPRDLPNILMTFKSKEDVKRSLDVLSKDHKLCKKLLGIESTKGSCFGTQIENCNGACTNSEKPLKYNLRFTEAFAKSKVKSWPFKGRIVVKEGNIGHLIDNWCYLGLINDNNVEEIDSFAQKPRFEWDTYKILSRYIFDPKSKAHITNI